MVNVLVCTFYTINSGEPTDFIHKLAIALKEANETEYWILLLRETDYLTPKESESMLNDLKELLKLLTSIIKTTKQKLNDS
ncbi:four helix bundle protein [Microcoleus sp. D2_18a_D3]|uniref:four helix bundle protein n=1 Tax=Microcoleus sp. D2_18a_D3 TaxID=3055330 RepID=UPI002FD2400B